MKQDKAQWLRITTEQIRFRYDRGKIREELLAHMEDHSEQLLRSGLSEEEAEEAAVAAMGDPVEVGRQLNAVHKPLLGWLWKLSGWLAMAAVAVLLFTVLLQQPSSGWYGREKEGNLAPFLQRDVSAYYRVQEAEPADVVKVGSRILYDDTTRPRAELRNRTIGMEKLAFWAFVTDVEGYSRNEYQSLYGILTVEDVWPLEDAPNLKHLYAVDSCGNRYWNWAAQAGGGTTWISHEMYLTRTSRGLTEWHYALELQGVPAEVRWVELRYDVDGNDFALRIDLTGGEAS